SNNDSITAAPTATVNLGGNFTNPTLAATFTTTGATVNIGSTAVMANAGTTLTLGDDSGTWRLVGGTINGGTVATTGSNALIGTSVEGLLANGVTLDGTFDLATINGARVGVTGGLT